MSTNQKDAVHSELNLYFDVRIPLRKPGQSEKVRLAREICSYLPHRHYMICSNGQIITAISRDMPTKVFVFDVEANCAQVVRYIKRHSQSRAEETDLPLRKVGVIPVGPYHVGDWRDGRLGIVCSGGFVTHLVRLDGRYGGMTVGQSAQAAYKLLVG